MNRFAVKTVEVRRREEPPFARAVTLGCLGVGWRRLGLSPSSERFR